MDNFFNLILLVIFTIASLLAFFTALILLVPAPIARVRQTLELGGLGGILLGLVNSIFFGIVSLMLVWLSNQAGGFIAGGQNHRNARCGAWWRGVDRVEAGHRPLAVPQQHGRQPPREREQRRNQQSHVTTKVSGARHRTAAMRCGHAPR